jgi:hypothetical protein
VARKLEPAAASGEAVPMRGKKRCRMHGGASTGPRTAQGLERSRRARWVHGQRSKEAIEVRKRANLETLEQGVARILREDRRAERIHMRQVRRLTQQIDAFLD